MVKRVAKFKCEITGKEFEKESDAIRHEDMIKDIEQTFSFFKQHKDDDCSFANGRYAIQRDEETYNKLIEALIKMIEKYESWIKKKMYIIPENVRGYSFVGRLLDDGDSPLFHWWSIQANICPECFREYGQMFYKSNCKHDNTIPTREGD